MSTDSASTKRQFKKPKAVIGTNLVFRDADTGDAEFILSLRLDPNKGKHLSATSGVLEDQVRWLQNYESDFDQIYFIIEDRSGDRIGTVRLYDVQGDSFCWGSWILSDKAPRSSAVESTIMIYSYAIGLGFEASHFDVRIANEKVWKYHERLGAIKIDEDDLNYYYSMSGEAIRALLAKYSDRLPNGVRIDY